MWPVLFTLQALLVFLLYKPVLFTLQALLDCLLSVASTYVLYNFVGLCYLCGQPFLLCKLYLTSLFHFPASFIYVFLFSTFLLSKLCWLFFSNFTCLSLYGQLSFTLQALLDCLLSVASTYVLCKLDGSSSHCPDVLLCKVPWLVSIWPALKSLPACLI
jgi:hypothetical protein